MYKVEFDERDQAILDERQAAFLARTGPQVGHYVRFADGTMRRISHVWDWGEPEKVSVQTSDAGSWHLGGSWISFSGSLYTGIPATTLTKTGETKDGRVWLFHHGFAGAYRGVNAHIPLPVWECSLPAPH